MQMGWHVAKKHRTETGSTTGVSSYSTVFVLGSVVLRWAKHQHPFGCHVRNHCQEYLHYYKAWKEILS